MGNLSACCKSETANDSGLVRRKLVIVGDGGCGKTCLLFRALGNGFQGDVYLPTVFETEVMTVTHQGKEVEMILYDTAGQEDYDRLRPFAYPDTDVVLACFAIDDPDSLVNIHERWIPEVRHFCGATIPILLVGTKADLRSAESSDAGKDNSSFDGSLDSILGEGEAPKKKRRQVTLVAEAEAQDVMQRKELVGYFETSAKANSGVTELFQTAIAAALNPKAFLKRQRNLRRKEKGSSKFSKLC